jgi:predicted TIM-barrel fold metal-dependent hydrolase
MPTGTRRYFLQGSLATAAALAFPRNPAHAAAAATGSSPAKSAAPDGFLTDVNVYLAQWPFRRLKSDEPRALAEKLRARGVKTAWTASLEALLHRDLAGVNLRLVEACRQHGTGLFVPFGAVNLTLPDWEEDLRRCHEVHGMKGIRLHPNYHGYKLDDRRLARLLENAERRGMIVQIATEMEDRRTQHPLAMVAPVDPSPLTEIAARLPRLKLIVLNLSLAGPLANRLAATGQVHLDSSHHEGLQGLSAALQSVPLARVLFGSHTPLFIYEANLLKLRESPLTEEQLRAIACENADRLVAL